jgi:hypothetical protein
MKGYWAVNLEMKLLTRGDVTTIELTLCGWSFEGSFALYCIDLT